LLVPGLPFFNKKIKFRIGINNNHPDLFTSCSLLTLKEIYGALKNKVIISLYKLETDAEIKANILNKSEKIINSINEDRPVNLKDLRKFTKIDLTMILNIFKNF